MRIAASSQRPERVGHGAYRPGSGCEKRTHRAAALGPLFTRMSQVSEHIGLSADERRTWARIDDRLLLSYRVEDGQEGGDAAGQMADLDRAVTTFITKPTADLLAQAEPSLTGSPLVPWLIKIDWLLNVILTSLAKIRPDAISLPELTKVSLSGGGLAFETPRPIKVGDMLSLTLVLPPFTPVHARAAVVDVAPPDAHVSRRRISVEFTAIEPDDQERLIRHILHAQAEQLRARRLGI